MILSLGEISERNRLRVLDDPPLVWQIVAPDDPDAYADARARVPRPNFLTRLLRSQPTKVAPLELEAGEGLDADLDKAWHGLHYLLTGTADGGEPPAHFLLLGGREIGTEDVGYGPARVLSAAETRRMEAFLADTSDRELLARFDARRMTALEIYPNIWDDEETSRQYLAENLTIVRRVIAGAVSRARGLLLVLS
jgi:hypothetical protein